VATVKARVEAATHELHRHIVSCRNDGPRQLGVGGRHPVAPLRGETERQVGPLECTSARKADSGTHGGGGAGKILKKIQAWLSIRRQGVRRR
jgi:hypothetical protein